jgi:hypothetical protein
MERLRTSGRLDLSTGWWFNSDMSQQDRVYPLKVNSERKPLIFTIIGPGLRLCGHQYSSSIGSVEI